MDHEIGTARILNVGAGDIKLSFDPNNPAERIRAARIVRDMLRRGFALLVEVEIDGVKKFQRAHDFKDDVCEYILADFDPTVVPAEEVEHDTPQQPEAEADATASNDTAGADAPAPKSKRGIVKRNIKAETTRAVAVGRTAGG